MGDPDVGHDAIRSRDRSNLHPLPKQKVRSKIIVRRRSERILAYHA
jgi:hypothetical protein